MKSLIIVITLLSGSLLFELTSANLQISKEDLEEKIDDFVQELLRCRYLTGANIAIVVGNDTVLTKGYGLVDKDRNATVTETTLFGIASLSKAFTATLLGTLLKKSEQGYDWDTTVRTVLGEDFYFYDALRTNNATLRDLLTHMMGFDAYNNIRHQSGLDRKTLAQKVRFMKPMLPFRTKFKYNNLMYGLLTHITEVIGGDSWENLMRQHIFQPLGMTSSDFTHEIDLDRPDLVRTYQLDFDGSYKPITPQIHSYWGKIGGSGSIVSNANEMTHWIKALLNQGRNQLGEQVIPNDVIEDTHTRLETIEMTESEEAFLRPNSPVSYTHFNYGLAWRLGYYRGWPTVLHTGTSMGYLAQLTLIPDLNIGIHSSFSGDDPGHTGRRLLHVYVMDLLMGESPWLNTTSACQFPQTQSYRKQKVKENKARSNGDFAIYTGTYGNFVFGNMTFYVNESTGDFVLSYGDYGIWDMIPTGTEHEFGAVGREHVWVWDFRSVMFSNSGESPQGTMDSILIPDLIRSDPPVFTRGLQMDQAPPPPKLDCSTDSSNGVRLQYTILLQLCLSLTFLTIWLRY